MSAKSKETSPRTLANINKQIIEIKKKIQLSEGQRKAAFEEYERERKICEDQILKLKKDIKELTVKLKENKDETAAYRIRNTKLEAVVGPLTNKTTNQVKDTLDLKIIDLKKHLDLLKHRKQQRKTVLENLAKEYQTLLSKKPKEEVVEKISKLFKKENSNDKGKKKKKKEKAPRKVDIEKELTPAYSKKFYALQNNIHRVDVQWREAEHIRNSYKAIQSTLLKNRSYFESSLKDLEEKRQNQQKDINELQRMNSEAANTRSAARLALEKEERTIIVSGRIRERQNVDQQALCAARRAELEKLERQIHLTAKLIGGPQAGAASTIVAERNDVEEDDRTGDEVTSSDEDETSIKEAFEKLQEATGVTNADDVFTKFQSQKETRNRLEYLKDTTEAEKKQLELTQNALSQELEKFRYAQERDKEKYGDDILQLKESICEQEKLKVEYEENSYIKEVLLQSLCNAIFNLYLSFKDVGIQPLKELSANTEKIELLLHTIFKDMENIVNRSEVVDEEDEEEAEEFKENPEEEEEPVSLNEDELLPSTYNILFRRTPVPMQGMQLTAPPAIDDEEEVPSRSLLKRQAQLVADAKSRRKALRIPMNRK